MPITSSKSIEKNIGHRREEEGREGREVKLKRILVPIDGSDYSMRAARYAIEIAKLKCRNILHSHNYKNTIWLCICRSIC